MATNFFSDEANLQYFASVMTPNDRDEYQSFGHLQLLSAFRDRLFVVYQPQGLNANRTHRQPKVLTNVRCTRLQADDTYGVEALLLDERTGATMTVGYIPKRMFSYDVFVQVPPFVQLRWDGHVDSRGATKHTLSFALLVKTKNRADYYTARNTYCLPPNRFRQLFPEAELSLS